MYNTHQPETARDPMWYGTPSALWWLTICDIFWSYVRSLFPYFALAAERK
jgi:hypothetical protein